MCTNTTSVPPCVVPHPSPSLTIRCCPISLQMIVSHDSGFLDNVCTDIIHYETRKLVHYKVGTAGYCNGGWVRACVFVVL